MNKNFSINISKGVELMSCDVLLHQGALNAFTTRHGGISANEFSSLNLGFSRGDDENKVTENYKRLALAVGKNTEDFILTKQTHGDTIIAVTDEHTGYGLTRPGFQDCDALITNCNEVVLCVFVADCVPILMLDPEKRVIAAVHSGWKGTAKQIGAKTVNKMHRLYGSDPHRIICAIGASVGPCCFEIGEDVAQVLSALPGGGHITRHEGAKPHADLWKTNRDILINSGVLPENIFIANECTVCNPEKYFSHRRCGDRRGTLAALISLLPEDSHKSL